MPQDTPVPSSEDVVTVPRAVLDTLRGDLQLANHRIALLREEIARLREGLVPIGGSERLRNANQLTLGVLEALVPAPDPTASTGTPASAGAAQGGGSGDTPRPRKKAERPPTGRKPIPREIPSMELRFVPDEVKANPGAFEKIGEDVSEVLERRVAGLVRVRCIREKYVPVGTRRGEETLVRVAPTPDLPIEGGKAGPALLAETIVERYRKHVPLNLQADGYAAAGAPIARSTLCGWHARLADLFSSVVKAMWADTLKQPLLLTDATGMPVQARGKCKRRHVWVVIAPGRHVVFRFTLDHTREAVDEVLRDFAGKHLVVDAHTSYNHLFEPDEDEDPRDLAECGCWSHARRKFYFQLHEDVRAREALERLGPAFAREKEWKDLPPDKRLELRREHVAPVLRDFITWAKDIHAQLRVGDALHRATGYVVRQERALTRFLEDGRIPMTNNVSERMLRPIARGRDAWLFVGTDERLDVLVTFQTLLGSARMHGVEPLGYFRDLSILCTRWRCPDMLMLSPLNWKQTRERQDVKDILERDPFRRIALSLPPS